MEEFVSVIVPAYNESTRIRPTIERLAGYLDERFPSHEIIVVDDGSADDTASVIRDLLRISGSIRLIRYEENRGKGYAMRTGVMSSKGDLVLMSDADLSTPIEEIEKLLSFIHEGFDIAVGSRALRESDIVVRQPWYRQLMGKTFNVFVQALVMRGIKDTQCGFKLFRGDAARRLFSIGRLDGFSFDAEILFLARKAGLRIKEVPIRWLNSPASRVALISDPMKMFLDLLRIRGYWLVGKYGGLQ